MEWVDPLGLGLINHKTFRLISDNMVIPPTTDVEPLDPSARDIESKMKRIEEDPEGAGTAHLFDCIQGVCSVANRAFGPLFERQEQAEKIRSVQGMLQRFRTLFNLPSAIRGSISKGEYDLAVREYRKAKSIVCFSSGNPGSFYEVGILRRVLEEIEKVVYEFKTMLYKAMEDPNVDLTSLENTVRLLLELEPESDPIKHYLNIQSAADYSLADENDHLAGDLFPEMTSEELDALRSSQVSADSSANNPVNKAEDRLVDYLDEVAGMICNTLSAYKSKVLTAFNDLEESNILNPHMNDAIKEISKASRAFEAKESAPSIAVTVLRTLEFEISKIYILRLCSWMRTSTEDILKDESWVPVSILERNKSPYSISSLPLAFRAIMVSAMDEINAMLQSLQSESANSEDVSSQLQDIQESIRLAFLNCLLDFAGHLEHIGSKLTQNKSNLGSMHFQNGYSHSHEAAERSVDPVPGSIVDPHLKLLMVLSNIGYCRDELAHELYGKYKHIWLHSRGKVDEDSDIQDLVMSYSGLEEKVLEQYTLAKTNLIRSAAVNYLLDAGVQWGAAPAVKGVRDVAVDLLHTLVAVHAEVFAGCKPLLDKTLGILVEGLIDIFLGLFNENKTKDLRALDPNGFSQLMLELEYFETILNPYFTHDARESLKTLQGVLLEKAIETVTEPVETPSHQRRATRGSDDVLPDDRSGSNVSPDDLIALAQQYSSELLQAELERTRINTACFVESLPLDSVPESAKAAYASFRGGSMGGAWILLAEALEAHSLLIHQVSGNGADELVFLSPFPLKFVPAIFAGCCILHSCTDIPLSGKNDKWMWGSSVHALQSSQQGLPIFYRNPQGQEITKRCS
ncbi:UNVERIFIED_CONTAM: Exocyst complex component SEC5B [Sesamum radiatum]|uniref:Exocyst complex component SEC5 n=1 Tax=Sesamum radiatum TaxID=300843 RepID=A0AAW2SH65_SESRA